MTDVLVADDEHAIADSTAALLRMAGLSVAVVHDAAAILPALRRERPRVLLQDVRMPGLALERHVAALRADPAGRDLVVVLFTATIAPAAVARRLGCEAVEKPYDPDLLLEAMRGWLGPVGSTSPRS